MEAKESASQNEWYERERAAFIAWWESDGQSKFSETPTLAAGAGWFARAETAVTEKVAAEVAARVTEPSPMFGQPEALLHFLKAAAQGTVTGDVSEWPQLRLACRWAVEQIEAVQS